MDELNKINSENQVSTLKETENFLTSKNLMLLVGCLFIGFLFNILFYDKPVGLSHPIFLTCFYSVFIYFNKIYLSKKPSQIIVYGTPTLLLSLTFLIFSNPIFRFLNFFGVFILAISHMLIVCNKDSIQWYNVKFLEKILHSFLIKPFEYAFKPFSIVFKLINKNTTEKNKTVFNVLKGLLISIPLISVILILLSSADKTFNKLVSFIPDLFENIDIVSFISRSFLILLVTIFSFSFILSFTRQKPTAAIQTNTPENTRKIFDPISTITVMLLVNIIYIIFVLIQFSYLFSSFLPEDFTYAEYARRGFFELIAVTIINLIIFLLNINLTKPSSSIPSKVLKILNTIMIACTMIMLVSAHLRMSMYEAAYGYTYLRIFTHGFMIFIFLLLIVSLIKLNKNNTPLLKSYIIIALICYTLINYINVDAIIAYLNIDRYYKEKLIDVDYLSTLYDAVPYLIKLTNDPEPEVSAKISEHLQSLKSKLEDPKSLPSFNFSEYNALKSISGNVINTQSNNN